ncbi:hypothetical protein [Photobacterium aquae]|uniref:hypothetical protein n=1 Tax=Photobacterium aquae TaxID=1195763 RepID=UPI00064C050B|nr:hypothetical protein [Photobacterium aquae]
MSVKLFPATVLALSIALSGCTTSINSEDIMAHRVNYLLDVTQYQDAQWFDASIHSVEPFKIRFDDGIRASGVRLSVEGSKNTVIYFGGAPYRDQKSDVDILGQFALLGLNVITVRNRSIDSHGNWPTLTQLKEDSEMVYQAARQKYRNEFLILHGTAVSSFWVSKMAAERDDVDALVLEGGITTFEEFAEEKNHLAWLREKLDLKQKVDVDSELTSLNNYKSLELFEGPMLVLAAQQDSLVPSGLANKLYDASPSMKKAVKVVNYADEKDLMMRDDALAAYMQFVQTYGWKDL